MTPETFEYEIALTYTIVFLTRHLEYRREKTLQVYPPSLICKCQNYLISEATLGDPYAQDILCDFANALTADDKSLPLWLQEYVVWAAQQGKIRRKRGRDRYADRHRNETIANAVNILVEDGFHPTRNAATTSECGSSITASALAQIDIQMSEGNVAAIWRADKVLAETYLSEWKKRPEPTCQDNRGCRCAQFDCEILKHHGPDFDQRIATLGGTAVSSRELSKIDLVELVPGEVRTCSDGDECVCEPSGKQDLHDLIASYCRRNEIINRCMNRARLMWVAETRRLHRTSNRPLAQMPEAVSRGLNLQSLAFLPSACASADP